MILRYGITKRDDDGGRVLTYPHRSDNLYDTVDAARLALAQMIANNSEGAVRSYLGDPDAVRVQPVPCYDSGDPMRTVFAEIERWPRQEKGAPYNYESAEHNAGTAIQCLTRHDHPWQWCGRTKAEKRDDENLTRSNCGACVLQGYQDRDDDEHKPEDGPNYAGWPRILVEARSDVRPEWHAAFIRELNERDNSSYIHALARSIETFGAPRSLQDSPEFWDAYYAAAAWGKYAPR